MFHGMLREYTGASSSEYLAGVVRLRVSDLSGLSEEGLQRVSDLSGLSEEGLQSVIRGVDQAIKDKANLVRHELEHALAYPEEDRSHLVVDILFSADDDNQPDKFNSVSAVIFDTRTASYTKPTELTDYQRAIISSAPTSLGNGDVVKSAYAVVMMRQDAEVANDDDKKAELLRQADEIELRYNTKQWHGEHGQELKPAGEILSMEEMIKIHPELEEILKAEQNA